VGCGGGGVVRFAQIKDMCFLRIDDELFNICIGFDIGCIIGIFRPGVRVKGRENTKEKLWKHGVKW
jgi:hypothetical protein